MWHAMCARKLRFSEAPTSYEIREQPKKEKLSLNALLKDESIPDDQIVRILRVRMTWKDWVKFDFLRYWFAVGAMAFNTFLVLNLASAYNVSDLIGAALLVILFAGLGIAEYLLYRKLWPEGILTRK